jgi:hypothetical protein
MANQRRSPSPASPDINTHTLLERHASHLLTFAGSVERQLPTTQQERRGTNRPSTPIENPRTFYSHLSGRSVAEEGAPELRGYSVQAERGDRSRGSSPSSNRPSHDDKSEGDSLARELEDAFTRATSPDYDIDMDVLRVGAPSKDAVSLEPYKHDEDRESEVDSLAREMEDAFAADHARASSLDYDIDTDISTTLAGEDEEDGNVRASIAGRCTGPTFGFDGYPVGPCQLSKEAYSPSVLTGASISSSSSEGTVQASGPGEGAVSSSNGEGAASSNEGVNAGPNGYVPDQTDFAIGLLPQRRIDFDIRCQIREGCKFCEHSIPHGRLRTREPSLYHLSPFRMTSPIEDGAPPEDDLTRRLRYYIDALSRWNTLELKPQTLSNIQHALDQLRQLLVDHFKGRILHVEEKLHACSLSEAATKVVFSEVPGLFDIAAEENRRILGVRDECHCELENAWIDLSMAAGELGYDREYEMPYGDGDVRSYEQYHDMMLYWRRTEVFVGLEKERRGQMGAGSDVPCMLVHW